MSGKAIEVHAHRLVQRAGLPEVAEHDVRAALSAADPGLPTLLCDVASEAEIEFEQRCERGAGLLFFYAAANLADDLSDAECDYLADAAVRGPTVLALLQSLGARTLSRAGIRAATLDRLLSELIVAAGAQQLELVTRPTGAWTLERTREILAGIGGAQFAGYFEILLQDTPHASRAREIGQALGFAAQLASDLRSRDSRVLALPVDQRAQLIGEARKRLAGAPTDGLPSVVRAAATIEAGFAT